MSKFTKRFYDKEPPNRIDYIGVLLYESIAPSLRSGNYNFFPFLCIDYILCVVIPFSPAIIVRAHELIRV